MNEVEKLRTMLKRARPNLFCSCDTCKELRDSIDAALAEPMVAEYSQDEVNAMTTDMISIRKEAERAAYRQGAEEMREKVAQWIRKIGWDMNPQVACSVGVLPIPEYKP